MVISVLVAASSATAASYEQQFPYPRDIVYAAVAATLPEVGLKVKAEDPTIARLVASAGMALNSMGENVSIAIVANGGSGSTLQWTSNRKMATNVLDGGRGLKLFNKLVLAVSARLRAADTKPGG